MNIHSPKNIYFDPYYPILTPEEQLEDETLTVIVFFLEYNITNTSEKYDEWMTSNTHLTKISHHKTYNDELHHQYPNIQQLPKKKRKIIYTYTYIITKKTPSMKLY